jgi:hypothetical protein
MRSVSAPISKTALRAGRILSGLAVAFLLFDSVIKLLVLPPVVQSFGQMGYPVSLAVAIGIIELVCLAVYVIPASSILGAILLTGYLGGAIATHVRIGSPLFTHILFPVYIAVLIWGGLLLREPRVRALVPLRE